MRRCALILIPALWLGAEQAALARDPTVGACTQRDAFAKSQDRLDPAVAQLSSAPEAKRPSLGAAIAKRFGAANIENLIRYREPAMKHVFVALLGDRRWPVRARALYGLKMTGDASVVAAVAACLKDRQAEVREMAANALCHMGDEKAGEALADRLGDEADPYVKASIEAAVAVLDKGEKPYASYKDGKTWSETLVGPEGARRVEWVWVKKGPQLFNDYDAKGYELPAAETWFYPIAGYGDDLFAGKPPRRSFKAGGNHAAEDCAWFREGCSYYAVADGVVRMIQGAGGDWGFLLVLEHRLPSGDYVVSLYGHAAWDVLVKPGDRVKAGQKIATEGLSTSVENGGYGSHIHFGIGDGPFRRSKLHLKGQGLDVEVAGRPVKGTIARIVYAETEKNGYGWPRLAAEVKVPGGETVTKVLEEEPVADQIAWMQAYVADCAGWLNPETFLPEHVK